MLCPIRPAGVALWPLASTSLACGLSETQGPATALPASGDVMPSLLLGLQLEELTKAIIRSPVSECYEQAAQNTADYCGIQAYM
ncbi:unnamed protein product [Lota lota]